MKIGYFLYQYAVLSGDSNGVKNQSRKWKEGLEQKGHEVVEINVWDNYDWQTFDVIHFFGADILMYELIKGIYKKNQNILLSPIIDSNQSKIMYGLSSHLGFEKFRLWSKTYALKKVLPFVKYVVVRSDYEERFFTESFGLSKKKVKKVELSYEYDTPTTDIFEKENFCFHVSSIYQPRKNVINLIKAAKKYNFRLILAGAKGTLVEYETIERAIGKAKNIQVLGYVSEDKLKELFKKAKVFALPSLFEGVGLVALNAALYGCNVVLTERGAPKEYYNGMAHLVNPLDIDSIGAAVNTALKQDANKLREYITVNYSPEKTINKLIEVYKNL
ncbi:glycosyltransferase [Flagellimonas crocea]|uniref:glycosyltransferase n=1 Tax=Flagellimonas crocea TaxID=3067311 RepID=UPI00296F0F26|nr:glycosyltransferase [Muricauda sp. DH64]